jgi:hypothetical protein
MKIVETKLSKSQMAELMWPIVKGQGLVTDNEEPVYFSWYPHISDHSAFGDFTLSFKVKEVGKVL